MTGYGRLREYQVSTIARMYSRMYLARLFEERVQEIFLKEPMPGTIHSSMGQEAVAVGVCEALEERDYIMTSHRGHSYFIARGTPPRAVMAELYAKTTGLCKGMGGSLHLSDYERRIPAAVGVVGAQIPMAAGIALASKLRGDNSVAVAAFGDGATNTGSFHEGINLAAVWKLPAVFVCENNLYAVSHHINKATVLKNLADKSQAYGIPGMTVDGNDVIEVCEAVRYAVDRARNGHGPSIVECKTYRHKGHSRFDPAVYRHKEEHQLWLDKDPVQAMRKSIVTQRMLTEEEVASIEREVQAVIDDAHEFARSSPDPAPDEGLRYVFANDYGREMRLVGGVVE